MYRAMQWIVRLALGFYFQRIERFHLERVPSSGPVLFTSNHPNSLTDSFVIGTSVPRRVNFVATVQLFRGAPLKWLLTHCGVIPINRVKDDPKAMRTITDTFEACYRVLERGEAIGIFPEGITYDDSQLKEIKSGAARMALELEHRHNGKLGLQITPVGLTFSAKEIYRSSALVNFGEPILVANFLRGYEERRKECIRSLTAEIEHLIQALILHIPELDHRRVVAGVKRLYLDRLVVGRSITYEPILPGAEELLLTQRIAEAVEQVYRTEPERAAAFAAKLSFYERWVARFKISDQDLARFSEKRTLAGKSLAWVIVAALLAPIALYGWVHRLIPFGLVRWAVRRFAEPGKRKAQTATVSIASGIVAFGLFYGACVLIFQRLFGWRAALWYGLSLPPASLIAHYYLRELRQGIGTVRNAILLWRAPSAAKRLLAMRRKLIVEIEAVREGKDVEIKV